VSGPTIRRQVTFHRAARGRKSLKDKRFATPPPAEVPRIPRVAQLLALAHRFDQVLRDGEAASYAELARLAGVSRARVTQIMRLLDLSPAIQEEILVGEAIFTERGLRAAVAEPDWEKQRLLL